MCGMTQISILQVALVFVWFLGVHTFPTLRDKKDSHPKITYHNTKHKELVDQLLSKWANDMAVKLRRRRASESVFPSVPTYTDRGKLYSKTNHFLTVFNNRTLRGIGDGMNSSYALLERQSFNTSIIRIMAVETGLYVAMNKRGRIVATNKMDNSSLWIENHEMNGFLTYQSYYMSYESNSTDNSNWFLAIKNNGRIRNGNGTNAGMNSAQFQFLMCNT